MTRASAANAEACLDGRSEGEAAPPLSARLRGFWRGRRPLARSAGFPRRRRWPRFRGRRHDRPDLSAPAVRTGFRPAGRGARGRHARDTACRRLNAALRGSSQASPAAVFRQRPRRRPGRAIRRGDDDRSRRAANRRRSAGSRSRIGARTRANPDEAPRRRVVRVDARWRRRPICSDEDRCRRRPARVAFASPVELHLAAWRRAAIVTVSPARLDASR